MGNHDFGRQFSRHAEQLWGQHRSGWAGNWQGGSGWGGLGRSGRTTAGRARRRGWPSCSASRRVQQRRGPKVRRGDVRAAILDMLQATSR